MFGRSDFANSIWNAKAQWEVVAKTLGEVQFPPITTLRIRFDALSSESLKELLKSVPSGYAKADSDTDYIYVIQISDGATGMVGELQTQLQKEKKNGTDYPRINAAHQDGITLYVGRSRNLKKRLREHLGAEAPGVYALHLKRWAPSVKAEIVISVIRFHETHDLVVQTIEDGIWETLKPAFGRKGGR